MSDKKDDLVDYELKVLRHIGGEAQEELIAGAAFWQALEVLRNRGYIEADKLGDTYWITEKGKEYLNER